MSASTPRHRRRVVLVGAGTVAEGSHLPALRGEKERVELVGVVDSDLARAGEVAGRWGARTSGADLASVLETERPDLAVICTPPMSHRDAVTHCLDAGAWVWCEKPPAVSLAEYDRMAAAESHGGPYVGYVFQHRFGSAARTFRDQVRDATLGRALVAVCHTLWYRDNNYYAAPGGGTGRPKAVAPR